MTRRAYTFFNEFNHKDWHSKFRILALEVAEFGRMAGVKVTPFQEDSLPHFSKLSSEQQLSAIHYLEKYHNICSAMLDRNEDLKSSYRIVWQALKEYELRPPSNLFDDLKNDYVIEIYDIASNTQLFRNFKFFTFCSYSLEDLACRPWPELFERDMNSFAEMMVPVQGTFSGKIWKDFRRPIKNYMKEIDSIFHYEMNYALLAAYPLRALNGAVEAFLVVEDAELLNPPTPREEEALFFKHNPPTQAAALTLLERP
jgi:hypothetical protein